MSLHQNIIDNLVGYSLAKYSTWFFYRPDRILFDCGEGVSTTLGNRIYGIERIVLSHGHGDHVAGLPGFLYSRASSMGDTEKPLDIYYPEGDRHIEKLRRYIESILPRPPYRLTWMPIGPGESIELSTPDRKLLTFRTQHIPRRCTLGYTIVEERTRLSPSFADLPQVDLVSIIRAQGRDHVSELYQKRLLVYSGDTVPLSPEEASGAEVLMHEATFLDDDQREHEIHATVPEALDVARKAGVGALLIFHLSTRYHRREIRESIHQSCRDLEIDFPVFYTFPRGLPTGFVTVETS